MSNITNQELSLLRSRPHSTKLWLSIYQPTTVLACQVNDTDIAHEEREIIYDNVTSGAFGNIKSGMTMLVGTSPGARDKGRIRVRSATSTIITVAENSHIDWEDDLYLTVINFFEIWSIFPFFILEGGIVSWFKDYDIGYTDQNSNFGSLVCAGPHRASFVNENIYYSATGTTNVGDQNVVYLWDFEGGNPTGSLAVTPGNVSYGSPGHYTTSLTVTTNVTGTTTSDTTYRHISIYDRPDEGNNPPILRWEMDQLSGSRDEGGYSCRFKIHEDVSLVVDGALIILFADDIYDETSQSIGGNYPNNQKIVFVGYVVEGSIEYNSENSFVEFDVISATGIMKSEEGPIVSLESVNSPSDWYEIDNMDVQKFLYHYLRWHSTVLLTSDFRYLNDDFVFQYQDTDPASLYDVVNNFMYNSLRGSFIADRQGLLWTEINAEAINNVTGSISVGMEILKQDWLGEPSIQEREQSPLSYIEMGGVAWSGISTGTFDAYLSGAPGNAHGYYGNSEDHQGLILTSQNQLNTLSGNVFAYQNSRYPNAIFNLAGNYRNLDIVPQEIQKLQIFPDDTQRDITFLGKEFHITSIDWRYDSSIEIFIPTISLHEITQGLAGVTVDIPVTPLDNLPELPSFMDTKFGLDFTSFPIIPIPNIDFPPNPWIPNPPPGDATELSCCSDFTIPSNINDLHISGELRNDGVSDARDVVGWIPNAVLRTSSHAHNTFLQVDGTFEQSNDYGVTWSSLVDDTTWHVKTYPDKLYEATDVISIASGRAKQFSLSNCFKLRAGWGGIELSLDPCDKGGTYSLSSYNLGGDFGSPQAFIGNNGFSGNGGGEWLWYIWKLEGAGGIGAGTFKVNVTANSGFVPAIKLMNATTLDATATPTMTGDTSGPGSISAGETKDVTGAIASPPVGSTSYFAIMIGFSGPIILNATINKISYVPSVGDEVTFWENCMDIIRVRINRMYLHNICR